MRDCSVILKDNLFVAKVLMVRVVFNLLVFIFIQFKLV